MDLIMLFGTCKECIIGLENPLRVICINYKDLKMLKFTTCFTVHKHSVKSLVKKTYRILIREKYFCN